MTRYTPEYWRDYWRLSLSSVVRRTYKAYPVIRHVHVHEDEETETDYHEPPADVPVMKVTIVKRRKRGHTEEYCGIWRPRGEGWEPDYHSEKRRWTRKVVYK
jgi:hypothetical protein